MSEVPEYFGTLFIGLLRKIKNGGFHDRQKGQMHTRKAMFFIFLKKRIQSIPKYSGIADISKTATELLIGEQLWS